MDAHCAESTRGYPGYKCSHCGHRILGVVVSNIRASSNGTLLQVRNIRGAQSLSNSLVIKIGPGIGIGCYPRCARCILIAARKEVAFFGRSKGRVSQVGAPGTRCSGSRRICFSRRIIRLVGGSGTVGEANCTR